MPAFWLFLFSATDLGRFCGRHFTRLSEIRQDLNENLCSKLLCMYRLHRRAFKSFDCRRFGRFTSTMSSSIFKVQEHAIPTCHIREYPRALADDENDELQLAVKQYTPRESPSSSENGVTIIGAHANGFPKVCFNPVFYGSNTDT